MSGGIVDIMNQIQTLNNTKSVKSALQAKPLVDDEQNADDLPDVKKPAKADKKPKKKKELEEDKPKKKKKKEKKDDAAMMDESIDNLAEEKKAKKKKDKEKEEKSSSKSDANYKLDLDALKVGETVQAFLDHKKIIDVKVEYVPKERAKWQMENTNGVKDMNTKKEYEKAWKLLNLKLNNGYPGSMEFIFNVSCTKTPKNRSALLINDALYIIPINDIDALKTSIAIFDGTQKQLEVMMQGYAHPDTSHDTRKAIAQELLKFRANDNKFGHSKYPRFFVEHYEELINKILKPLYTKIDHASKDETATAATTDKKPKAKGAAATKSIVDKAYDGDLTRGDLLKTVKCKDDILRMFKHIDPFMAERFVTYGNDVKSDMDPKHVLHWSLGLKKLFNDVFGTHHNSYEHAIVNAGRLQFQDVASKCFQHVKKNEEEGMKQVIDLLFMLIRPDMAEYQCSRQQRIVAETVAQEKKAKKKVTIDDDDDDDNKEKEKATTTTTTTTAATAVAVAATNGIKRKAPEQEDTKKEKRDQSDDSDSSSDDDDDDDDTEKEKEKEDTTTTTTAKRLKTEETSEIIERKMKLAEPNVPLNTTQTKMDSFLPSSSSSSASSVTPSSISSSSTTQTIVPATPPPTTTTKMNGVVSKPTVTTAAATPVISSSSLLSSTSTPSTTKSSNAVSDNNNNGKEGSDDDEDDDEEEEDDDDTMPTKAATSTSNSSSSGTSKSSHGAFTGLFSKF